MTRFRKFTHREMLKSTAALSASFASVISLPGILSSGKKLKHSPTEENHQIKQVLVSCP